MLCSEKAVSPDTAFSLSPEAGLTIGQTSHFFSRLPAYVSATVRSSFYFIIAYLALAPALQAGDEVLAHVAAIRALSPARAAENLPVRLEATVTHFDQKREVFFVSESGDGLFIEMAAVAQLEPPPEPGDRVVIEGTTAPGDFLPIVKLARLTRQGHGPPLSPLWRDAEELMRPDLDAQWIAVRALVKRTLLEGESLVLEVEIQGWRFKVFMAEQERFITPPWHLVEKYVRLKCVAATVFNEQRQMCGRMFYTPSLAFLQDESDNNPSTSAPLLRPDALLQSGSSLRQAVRVRGAVTHLITGQGLYIRGEGGGLFVQTSQPLALVMGDVVEAMGYPVFTPFRPALSAVEVHKIDHGPPAKPLPLDPKVKATSREHHELITLQAELLDVAPQGSLISLQCSAEGHAFESLLASAPAEPLERGMRLALTGICQLRSTNIMEHSKLAHGFQLTLRSPADIVILSRAPWWTTARALWVLATMAIIALLIGGWAISLRREVAVQTHVIRHHSERQAALEERSRIARELHDTLEQDLIGVTMLLDDTAAKIPNQASQATKSLTIARNLLRRSREESRSTIRDLRSVTLEQRGLPAALTELLDPLASAAGMSFTSTITGEPRRLNRAIESNLLRIAHEAVANAARHSKASAIALKLDYTPEHVCLEVCDQGVGFKADAALPNDGHFGLRGMTERVEKIGATLSIVSTLEHGTTVRVIAPCHAANGEPPLVASAIPTPAP